MTNVLLEIFLQTKSSVALAMHSRSLSLDLHMMSLNIDMKIIRPLIARFDHGLMDFVDELQSGESWEHIPLHRFSVNCVQSSVL